MDTDVYSYLRTHATELGSRILETYPPLQSTKDLVALPIATLLRKALPAQALEVTRSAEKTVGTFVGRLLQKRWAIVGGTHSFFGAESPRNSLKISNI